MFPYHDLFEFRDSEAFHAAATRKERWQNLFIMIFFCRYNLLRNCDEMSSIESSFSYWYFFMSCLFCM